MLDIKETKTEENLREAFARECKKRNTYDYYAEQALAEGYNDIADKFSKMANNAKEHGKIWYKMMNGGMGTTRENIEKIMENGDRSDKDLYDNYAKDARNDGLDEIADLFDAVKEIRNTHNKEMGDMLHITNEEYENNTEGEKKWECNVCGFLIIDTNIHKRVPVCGYRNTFKEKTT